MTEREKSPVSRNAVIPERVKSPGLVVLDPGHALQEEVSLKGAASRAEVMETSLSSAPTGATAGKEVELEQSCGMPGTSAGSSLAPSLLVFGLGPT